jgi:hypothetical protein
MTIQFFKSAMLSTAAALALACLAPGMASAQSQYKPPYGTSYDQSGQYYYDGCSRDTTNRAVVGGAVGAGAGAIIGNSMVNKRHDSGQGALIGGLLGAVIGASVGSSTAACTPEPKQVVVQAPPPPPPSRDVRVYRSAPPPPAAPPPYAYNDRSYDQGYRDDYDYRSAPPPPAAKPECTYIEDAVRMPNGAMAKRMVHVCEDRNGEYQIVD